MGMTYPMYGNNPQNLLVANQFNPESFQVVQQVYYSLEQLRTVYRYLSYIETLGSSMGTIKNIEPYIRDITNVSFNLTHIIEMNENIPFIKEITPKVNELLDGMDMIQDKLVYHQTKFDEVLGLMETNTKHLEDLYCQYEVGLSNLIEQYKAELCETHAFNMEEQMGLVNKIEQFRHELVFGMNKVNMAVENQDKQEALLAHLQASDLVTLAQFSGSEEDFSKALKQIKQSEAYGTDESLNRKRLNYKLESNNVLNVLHENEHRLQEEYTK